MSTINLIIFSNFHLPSWFFLYVCSHFLTEITKQMRPFKSGENSQKRKRESGPSCTVSGHLSLSSVLTRSYTSLILNVLGGDLDVILT